MANLLATLRSTPLWVKVFGVIGIVVGLLAVVLLLFGNGHGPGRHIPSDDAGGQTPSTEQGLQPGSPDGHTPPIQHGP